MNERTNEQALSFLTDVLALLPSTSKATGMLFLLCKTSPVSELFCLCQVTTVSQLPTLKTHCHLQILPFLLSLIKLCQGISLPLNISPMPFYCYHNPSRFLFPNTCNNHQADFPNSRLFSLKFML